MKSLQQQLQEIAKKQSKQAETVMKKSMFRVMSSAVIKSPVDKGYFRANWVVGYNKVNGETFDSVSRDSQGALMIALGSFKMGGVLYFTNSLPYAPRLEYNSWSNQAPNGMVRLAARNWGSIVEDEVRKAR